MLGRKSYTKPENKCKHLMKVEGNIIKSIIGTGDDQVVFAFNLPKKSKIIGLVFHDGNIKPDAVRVVIFIEDKLKASYNLKLGYCNDVNIAVENGGLLRVRVYHDVSKLTAFYEI